MPDQPLPTFIVIGPGRTGTTMLYETFRQHPEICLAQNTKATNFFNLEYARGPVWYSQFFSSCQGARAIGELSNLYIYDALVPERIKTVLPSVKLITVLRNPFERIISVVQYRQRSGELNPALTIAEAIHQTPELIVQNYYADQLERYLSHFPKEQLSIMFYDDLLADPGAFIQEIFRFLQVDDSIIPETVFRRINAAARARSPLVSSVSRIAADQLRRWQLLGVLRHLKSSAFLRRGLYKPAEQPAVSALPAETMRVLYDEFIPQIERVSQLTNRSLKSWHPKL